MKIVTDFKTLNQHDLHLAYCGMDTMLTHELFGILEPKLKEVRPVYEFEKSLLNPIHTMMNRGIKIDSEARDLLVNEAQKRIDSYCLILDDLTKHLTGSALNPNSHVQLKKFFFDTLMVPTQTHSKAGVRSITCNRVALERIGKNYRLARPFVKLILSIRDLEKQCQTLNKDLAAGDRWAAGYNVAGTDTGRWSSSDHPLRHSANVQNIDPCLRQVFIAEPDHYLVYCDLAGAEARAVAYLSEDINYIEAVEKSDVHSEVAAMVFGMPSTRGAFAGGNKVSVDSEFYRGLTYRDIAKRLTHGTNYYGSARTLASVAQVETKLVQEFQRKFFNSFPGIRLWHQSIARNIQKDQQITTPLGRRRIFYERTWSDNTLRKAIAFGPQSVVADIMAQGLKKVWQTLEPEVKLQAMIHDAIVASIPKKNFPELLRRVLECLTVTVEIHNRKMTIPVDAEYGLNWGKFSDKNPNGLKKWKD